MKNVSTGLVTEVPTGFSWTTFFFGFFVPLFRGMYGYAAILALASLVTFGLSALVFPFLINKQHVKSLLEKGYKPCSPEDVSAVVALGIGYSAPQATPPQIREAA